MVMEFVQQNLLLVAVAAISGGMLVWPVLRKGSGGPWVDTLQATQMINRQDAVLIDVREATEFAQGHAIGARNLPEAQIESRAGEVAKNKAKPVIVYCADGNRASRALGVLKRLGYGSVVNLSGGYAGWQQAGLPTEK